MTLTPVCFVTGGSGFIGRHLCRLLTEQGFEVRAVVRNPDSELSSLGVKLWFADLWDNDVLEDAVSGVNLLIHCAGDARFGNGTHYYRANVELTGHLVHATKQYAEKDCRFIYVSTIGAIDRHRNDTCLTPLNEESPACPSSDYGKSKLKAEELVKNSGLLFSIIRPAMVVGRDMRADSHFAVFARNALSGAFMAKVGWPGHFSVVHVDDLANAILTVALNKQAEGGTYFCAGTPVSIVDYFHYCNPNRSRIPLSLFLPILRPLAKWLPFSLKSMLWPALTASDEKLKKLGWTPQYSDWSALEEVVKREKARLDPNESPGGQTVVTGAASGLGRALAVYLSSRRERLLLVDKDAVALDELANSLGSCSTSIVDLSVETEVDAFLQSPEWLAYRVTELYACAGIGLRGAMQDISIENHRKMFAVNVLARIAMTKTSIASMRKNHFGRIVLISSSSAFQPLPYMATYAATNSALLSIGESWGVEVEKDKVQLMTVCPGGMQTNFQKSGGVKELEGEKLMPTEEVVAEIFRGLSLGRQTLIVSFRSFAMSMLSRCLSRRFSVKLWCRLMEKMR